VHLTSKNQIVNKYPAICLAQGHEYRFIYPAEISKIVLADKGTIVSLSCDEDIKVNKCLKDLEVLLPDDLFVRVHHSSIINLMYVAKYIQNEDNRIVMRCGAEVPLSRRKKTEFLSKFTRL